MTLLGALAPLALYVVVLALHVALPARVVTGYARDARTQRPLRYRLNGVVVFAVVVGSWLAATTLGVCDAAWWFDERWSAAAGACALGVVVSAAFVVGAERASSSSSSSSSSSFAVDYYLGRRANPQCTIGGVLVDAKMALYLVGAVLLELNVLSSYAAFVQRHAAAVDGGASLWSPSPSTSGVATHAALLTFFCVEYLVFEEPHLYTYDFFAERVGFKLTWGCTFFYPFFYALGAFAAAAADSSSSSASASTLSLSPLAGTLLFALGWTLTRGANMQKFTFKRDPRARFLGLIAPRTIDARTVDGARSQLLASGFWGVARHVNYAGEVVQAVALALVLRGVGGVVPFLYPLYYVVLLGTRERDDHRRCARKYGDAWRRYCKLVPARIVPGVY